MRERRPRTALRQARIAAGLSQSQAARLAGYTHGSAWCQIENGINTPSLHRMRRIAQVVKRPVLEIFPEVRDLLLGEEAGDGS